VDICANTSDRRRPYGNLLGGAKGHAIVLRSLMTEFEPASARSSAARNPAAPLERSPGGTILVLIGIFKLAKALLLLLLGLAALHLVHRNLAAVIMGIARYAHADLNGNGSTGFFPTHYCFLRPGSGS
jgi:hypothetical protein